MKLAQLLTVVFVVSEAKRTKRIIDGIPLWSRHGAYDVVRYFTWISSGHECDFSSPIDTKKKLTPPFSGMLQCQPEPSHLYCTGALITPAIVQTACHCLAQFQPNNEVKDGLHRAQVRSWWEALMKVYVGFNEVAKMTGGVPSAGYFVHDKCTRLTWQGKTVILHDYGWISMRNQVDQIKELDPVLQLIDFAPVYTTKELVATWKRILTNSLACLHLGCGGYAKTEEGELLNDKSPVLRHGWAYALNYKSCFIHANNDFPKFNYTEDATWICSKTMRKSPSFEPHFGDSGGPVTCDNQYAGVVSMVKVYGLDVSFILDMATAFAVFQNAFEYRMPFITAMTHLNTDETLTVPTILPSDFTVV